MVIYTNFALTRIYKKYYLQAILFCAQCSTEFHSSELLEHISNEEHGENANIQILVDSELITEMTLNQLKFAYQELTRKLRFNGVTNQTIPKMTIEYDGDATAILFEVNEEAEGTWLPLFGNKLFENYVLHSIVRMLPNALLKRIVSPMMHFVRIVATKLWIIARVIS